MVVCKERMIKVLPGTYEMLGHRRYFYFHITVPLHKPTEWSGTWTVRMGSDSRSCSSGMLQTVFGAVSFTEHCRNTTAIMGVKSWSSILTNSQLCWDLFCLLWHPELDIQFTPANTSFRVLEVNDMPINTQVPAVRCTKASSRKWGILQLSLLVSNPMALLPSTQNQSSAVDSMAKAIPPVLGSFSSPLRCTATSHGFYLFKIIVVGNHSQGWHISFSRGPHEVGSMHWTVKYNITSWHYNSIL